MCRRNVLKNRKNRPQTGSRLGIIMILKTSLCLWLMVTAATAQYFGDYECEEGRDVMVHLFEWKWSDIGAACASLSAAGYCGVQISPPQEHIVYTDGVSYPWWQRYQPVSYIATSRSGDEDAFQNMVAQCSGAGVRIYADAVINHMTGAGIGVGSAGNLWNGGDDENDQSYPAVPYNENSFNRRDLCNTTNMAIEDFNDENEVRNCRFYGLRDLSLSDQDVRDKIIDYLLKLFDWGVAGIRVDAARNMWTGDLRMIYNGISTYLPFIFQEVIQVDGEAVQPEDYTGQARITEFRFGRRLSEVISNPDTFNLADIQNFATDWNLVPSNEAVVFIDNHDTQRGHGDGQSVLTYKQPREYKMAVAFMLATNYGYPRVMSSYAFDNSDQGPPSDVDGNTNDVDCTSADWICEHTWQQISGMVKFHNAVGNDDVVNWWDNGANAIAFGRGNKGFIVINNEASTVSESFQTGLPAGEYCDVISCEGNVAPCSGGSCRGSITVDETGNANIDVPNDDDPVRAYYV